MKITEVESILFGGGHFVRVHADNGLHGVGQSGLWSFPAAVHEVVRTVTPHLLGADPMRIERHTQSVRSFGSFRGAAVSAAISAVDIALWDLKGKFLRQPLWQLLGGQYRDRVRLLANLSTSSVEILVREAQAAVADGYTAIKFDPLWPGYQDSSLRQLCDAVAEAIGAARDCVGPGVDIGIELHRKLSPLQFSALKERLARFDLLFVEDPVIAESTTAQARLTNQTSLPIALGERMHTLWEFRELLEQGQSIFCRPDVGLAGGITHVKKIAALAESYHAVMCMHNFLGPVSTAACVHLDVSMPNFVVQEYTPHVDEGPCAAAFPGRLVRDGGFLPVPERPGLGVELDESFGGSLFPNGMPSAPRLRADGSVAPAV